MKQLARQTRPKLDEQVRDFDEDVYRAAEELGIDLSRPERGSDEEDERRAAGLLAR